MNFFKTTSLFLALSLSFGITLPAHAVDFGTFDQENSWADVVALGFERSGGEVEIHCSGVLVHPLVVLTAAHCLQSGGVRPGRAEQQRLAQSLRVHFGTGGEDGIGELFRAGAGAAQIHLHPGYLRDIRGQADLAVLVLTKAGAGACGERSVPIALDLLLLRERVRNTSQLTVVGFGHSEQPRGTGRADRRSVFGLKHFRRGPKIEGKTSDEIKVGGGAALDSFRPAPAQAPREGDSGGPAFYRDCGWAGLPGGHRLPGHPPQSAAPSAPPSPSSATPSAGSRTRAQVRLRLRPETDEPDYCSQSRRGRATPTKRSKRCGSWSNAATATALPLSAAYTIYAAPKRLLNERECGPLAKSLEERTNLSLDATHITDLSPLANLPALERLSLRDNTIQFIAPLRHLSRLRYLDISYNNVREAWQQLPHHKPENLWLIGERRQRWNIARTNFIRMCGRPGIPASAQATIRAIMDSFGMRQGECVNANYELIRMRHLEIFRARGLTDMSPLQGLNTLESLNLSGQAVESLEFLREIDDLRVLKLDGNPVTDLSPLLQHKNLRELSVRNLNPDRRQLFPAAQKIASFGCNWQ
jgi:hypothetical protein